MDSFEIPSLKRIDKIFYGMGRFGSTTLLTLISLATFYLYKEIYLLNDVLNGYANAIGKIAIAISSFVMGYISDIKVHPRLGKRKPFIVTGSILLAFSFTMLFFPHIFVDITNQIQLFLYEALWLASFNFFYGYLLTPYQAWLPEITKPDERMEVSGYENVFNVLGNMVGMGGSFAIPLVAETNPQILYQFIIAISIIEIIFYIPATIRIREPKFYIKQPNLIKDVKKIVTDRNFMHWIGSRGLMSLGQTILFAVLLGFLDKFLHLVGLAYIGTAAFLLILIMFSFALWLKLREKYNLKKMLVVGNILLMVPLALLITLLPKYDIAVKQKIAIVLLTLGAFGISAYWILNYVILANIIDANTKRTGESLAGAYTGFDGIILNIFQATGYAITGHIFAIFGNYAGYVVWGPIAALFIFLGTIYFVYKVDPEPKIIFEEGI